MSNLLERLFQYDFMLYLSIVIPIVMAIGMLLFRRKSVLQPMTVRKILLPTYFMSTGLIMFFFPFFHVTLKLLIEALVIGLIFSVILIRMSKFEVKNNDIYLVPSKYLFVLLLLFFVIRLLIKLSIGTWINIGETAGVFFILAFSTLCTWRIAMAVKYVKLKKK